MFPALHRVARQVSAHGWPSFQIRQYAAASGSSTVDQMIQYALSQRKDNPDMAIDVLRSGLSHPTGGPVDTARLQLALATIEAERNNWADATSHSSSSLRLVAPLAAAPGVSSAAAAAGVALQAGSLGVRSLLVQGGCGADREAHALSYECEQALRAAVAAAPAADNAAVRGFHTRSLGLLVVAAGGDAAMAAAISSSGSGGGGGGGAGGSPDAASTAAAAVEQLRTALDDDLTAAVAKDPATAEAVHALGLWRALRGGGIEAAAAGDRGGGDAQAAFAAAARCTAKLDEHGKGQGEERQLALEVEADALVGQAQLQMRAKEWGPAEELLGSALKAAEAAHGERSPLLALLLALLGHTYSRSARVTFAEGLYREAAKLLHLDPARQQGLAPPRLPATCGVHPSVGAMLAWRYAQLLWALPNRGGEAALWEKCALHYWAASWGVQQQQGQGQQERPQGPGVAAARDIEVVLGGKGHLKGEGPEGSGLLCSTRYRRAWPCA